ncbi:MAG TPA: transcriptional repressor LexA [Longimicrobiaceae bacterium]|nr:transcriptional repressor LexA [Longimicrobiaceae bacterium]
MPLTKRQRQILDYVESFIEGYGYSPSYEEIASFFGYSSLATVHEHLSNLEQKGYLRKNYNKSRSLELVPAEGTLAVDLPLLGSVAAGLPIEVIEEQETLAVPHDMLRSGSNYVLRVKGDSMIEEQIRDGDYIVVHSRQTAENGEMVVALVESESATVKKFYRERDGRIRLQPANMTMQPMYYPEADVQIQGIVVAVIRKY